MFENAIMEKMQEKERDKEEIVKKCGHRQETCLSMSTTNRVKKAKINKNSVFAGETRITLFLFFPLSLG
jgi:hypothetical protein